jgi:hypothetical protein
MAAGTILPRFVHESDGWFWIRELSN